MNKESYNADLLLRYLYQEVNINDAQAINDARASDTVLDTELNHLAQAKRTSSNIRFEPKMSSLDAILKYATEANEPVESGA